MTWPVSKRIVAQEGGAKVRVRPRPADPALTWELAPGENSVIVKQSVAPRHSHKTPILQPQTPTE